MNEAPFHLQELVLGDTRERASHTKYVYVLGECERKIKLIYKIPKVWSFCVFIHIFYPLSYIIVSFEPWV